MHIQAYSSIYGHEYRPLIWNCMKVQCLFVLKDRSLVTDWCLHKVLDES